MALDSQQEGERAWRGRVAYYKYALESLGRERAIEGEKQRERERDTLFQKQRRERESVRKVRRQSFKNRQLVGRFRV